MAIYTTRWFDRWARNQGLTAASLCAAVREMANGLYDADLGGNLYKKRIARHGARQEWRLSHAGRHQQGKPLDFRIRFSKERTQQHRQG
ncbi:MAG: type II toxin-antitoxin system RelE/ParE family toxin [Sulfuritalea sp.]|nr:type II toxin-antitoxin system RelE/ParE family toxin [Sulfuritalea sp.]